MIGRSQLLGLFAALAVSFGGGGCVCVLRTPDEGGRRWLEVQSAHFTLRTDAGEAAARERVLRMERTRQVLLALLAPNAPDVPNRLEVVWPSNREELRRYVPSDQPAFLAYTPLGNVLVLGTARHVSSEDRIIAHELAHLVASYHVTHAPVWLVEGLAQYFSTLEADPSLTRVSFGGADRFHRAELTRYGRMPLEQLAHFSTVNFGPPEETKRFQVGSWLLVSYLMFSRADALFDLQAQLSAGTPAQEAFRKELPGLERERLETDLRRFSVSLPEPTPRWREVPLQPVESSVRPMTAGQVHLLRAVLAELALERFVLADAKQLRADQRADLAKALAADPTNPSALRLAAVAGISRPALLERARQGTRAHPDAWQAWGALLEILDVHDLSQEAELAAAAERMAALAPEQPEPLLVQAALLLRARQNDDAYAAAQRALGKAPDQLRVLVLYAVLAAATGHCEEADATLPVAEAALGEHGAFRFPGATDGLAAAARACPPVEQPSSIPP